MKKIINQIPDRYYLISMAFILFIMVLGRYMFPGLMSKWDMLLYFIPQLFLPFTIIFIAYFYIKDNHSKKIVDMLYLFKLTRIKDNELLVVDNKKILSIFMLYMLLWNIQLHVIGLYFIPALLYLSLINMSAQYKINKYFIYFYKYLNIIFLSFFVLNIYLPPELKFISLNLNKVYFKVLYIYFLLIVVFLIYLKLKLEKSYMYIIASLFICLMIFYFNVDVSYYWFIVFLLGFMMPYYKSNIKSIGLVILLFIIVYLLGQEKSFLPSATPHLYLWHNNNKCETILFVKGDFHIDNIYGGLPRWRSGKLITTSCKDMVEDFSKFRFKYKGYVNEKNN